MPNTASMRPRHYTAENGHRTCLPAPRTGRFNEAAALHRGKQHVNAVQTQRRRLASMRPRHYTAENETVARAPSRISGGFNEAAALHRGKHGRALPPLQSAASFNEAAALHRGKQPSSNGKP